MSAINTQEASLGELDVAAAQIGSMAPESGGTAPGNPGNSDGEVAASTVGHTVGLALTAIAAAVEIAADITGGNKPAVQQSSFFGATAAPASKGARPSSFMGTSVTTQPVVARQVEIVPLSYGQKRAAATASRYVNGNVSSGAAGATPAKDSRDLFGDLKLTEMRTGGSAFMPKGAKMPPKGPPMTEADAIAMGLPAQVVANLAAILHARANPTLISLQNSGNDARALEARENISPSMRQNIAPTPQQAPTPKAPSAAM